MTGMISTTFYWRGWLGLVEILVDQDASLPRVSLIGGDDEFNGEIMRVKGGHGTVYSIEFILK